LDKRVKGTVNESDVVTLLLFAMHGRGKERDISSSCSVKGVRAV
jgi:hypothetical protein